MRTDGAYFAPSATRFTGCPSVAAQQCTRKRPDRPPTGGSRLTVPVLPHGTWPSPITAESLTDGVLGLGTAAFDGPDLYWLQSSPTDAGRVSLWRRRGEVETELTPAPYDVRSRVHEYGGGAFAAARGRVVFSDFRDGRLYLITDDEPEPRPLTADPELRYGALRVSVEHGLLIAVREDHRDDDHEPVNTVIARRLDDRPEVPDRLLCAGADFYASPELAADGRLSWVEWLHPNMPWDSTRLMIAALPRNAAGAVDLEPRTGETLVGRQLAGGPGESVAVPRWTPDGSLIFVSDRSDWWNLYRHDGDTATALCPMDAEFAPPQWSLGSQPYVIIDDDHIACSWNVGNLDHLGVLRLSTGDLDELNTGAVAVGSLSCNGNQLVVGLAFADRPSRLVVIDLASAEQTILRRSSERAIDPATLSEAVQVQWDSTLGPVHGWFYPPRNDQYDHARSEHDPSSEGSIDHGLVSARPPMITVSHGGPTGGSAPVYDPEIQFWTSRGIAVLDVNYGGSTGYGRRYRERLHRAWGVVDVEDCAAGARAMAEQGRVDPRRLAIQGSSAGGYTTLRALTATDVFTAGISRYGIGDLTALVSDTHKFESRYPESLIGAYPAEAAIYAERSPINHLDQLNAPILLLQGTEDKVVPPNQAETFANAARAKGLPVALIMYPGEGHGFRRAENIVSSQQAALSFLGRVFGFTPADELPELAIENL